MSIRSMLRMERCWRLLVVWGFAVLAIWTLSYRISRDPHVAAKSPRAPKTAIAAMSAWDGTHYEAIAKQGYSTSGPDIRGFNFFPLYPKAAGLLGGTSQAMVAGVIISQLMALASMLLMSAMAHGSKPAPLLREPGFWMLLDPFSFFLFSFYTESTFLFLTLVHYAAFRCDRPKVSFLAGFLAGLTRPTALVLPALLGVEALRRKSRGENWKITAVCAMAPLIALALYVIGYVGWRTGNINGYMEMSHRYWPQSVAFPFRLYIESLGVTIRKIAMGTIPEFGILIRTLSTTAVLGVLITRRKSIEPALMAYAVATLIFVHAISPLRSTGRFELVLFPVFFALAASGLARLRLVWIVVPACAWLWMTAFVHFASWDWIA